ncbi:hypothetical protein KC316_g15137 [Hortaea werneckii]|nr:hypothetical protein KC324_g16335 [Hortaea werneckii]KAI7543549.1 hypothetical protein KC316_g15137 [Hortaea werneckii]
MGLVHYKAMQPPKDPPVEERPPVEEHSRAEELAKHNLRQIIAGSHNAEERSERLRNLEYREYREFDKDHNTSSAPCLEIIGFLVTFNLQVHDYTGCKPDSYRPPYCIDVWMSPNLHIPLSQLVRGYIGSKLLADLLEIPEEDFWDWVEQFGGHRHEMQLHEFVLDPFDQPPTVVYRPTEDTFKVPKSDLDRMEDILWKDIFRAARDRGGMRQRLRRFFGKWRC